MAFGDPPFEARVLGRVGGALSRLRAFLLPGLTYLALAVVWALPSSVSPRDTVPDPGDPLHLAYVMAWDAHQLVHRPWALFDANSFHPYPRSLAFADHLTPEALMVAPLLWTTGNPVLAFNASVVMALALSALAMFALVRRVTGRGDAAFLAGLAYAFTSFARHELPRVHVLHVQWWPLALLFLLRFADRGRRRDAALFAASLALQALSGTYYLAYSLLLLPVWLAGAYVGCRRLPGRREVLVLGAALVGAALVVLPFVLPYLAQFRAMGIEKELVDGADLLSYVDPEPESVLWRVPRLGVARELPHFVGFVAGACAVAGALRLTRRRFSGEGHALAWISVATGLVALLLSLGPTIRVAGAPWGPGPYALLHRLVPPARGMASPERIGVLVTLATAALTGLGVAALQTRLKRVAGVAVTAALAAVLPLEHWTPSRRPALVPTGPDVPAVYDALRDGSGPLVELPLYPDVARKLWAAYPFFSTRHWRPVPIGRTSFYPPAHDLLAWSLRDFPDDRSLALLDRLGLRTIVVHPYVWSADERRVRLAAVETEPRLRLVRSFDDRMPARLAAFGLGEERIYALAPAAAGPPPCAPVDALDRSGWTLSASGESDPELVRDGETRTAWRTAQPQRPGDRLEVRLAAPDTVSAVSLAMAYPFDEFPRNLVLLVDDEAEGWQRVPYADGPEERWQTIQDLLQRPRAASLVLRLPESRRVRGVRLMIGLREEDPSWPRWRVPEVALFRACR
jgi:hypothetical protein